MKTTIKYTETFSIPKTLHHGFDPSDSDSDIFCDSIEVDGERLLLSSRCGVTKFARWEETEDGYIIPAGGWGEYEGAYSAMNAVVGIEFPKSTIGEVESSYGTFKTVEGYQLARRAVAFAQLADANNAIGAASASMDTIADRLGNPV